MEHITEPGDNRPKYFFIVWHVYSEYFKMVSIRIPFPPQIHIFLVWKWQEKLSYACGLWAKKLSLKAGDDLEFLPPGKIGGV